MKKLLLTDGNSMLFRAYYATAYGKPMTTKQGLPTNAVFGFASMFQKALDIVSPDAVLVAFDAGKHTFRHDLYPDYKGGRKPAPDDLVPQFQMVRDMLDAFAVRWVEMPDIEADDLIGTVSAKLADDYQTYILTSDHDMLQLIDPTTTVVLMKKGLTEMDLMTEEALREEMGIKPYQIIELKGLMGDKSDNIPGVAGIGEKTALKLLQEYDTVENVIAHEDELKGALQKKIMSSHDLALLSRKLAEIRRDVSLDLTSEDLRFAPDYEGMVRFLRSLDMNALSERFAKNIAKEETPAEAEEETPAAAAVRVTRMPAEALKADCAVYIDETGGSFLSAEPLGIALCSAKGKYYISLADAEQDEDLLAFLKSDAYGKTGFDIKRNMHLLQNTKISVSWQDDAMILAALADSTLTSTEKIFEHYQLKPAVSREDVYGKPNRPVLFADEALQCEYACSMADCIMKLKEAAMPTVAENGIEKLYREIELPLSAILWKMENEGIRCEEGILNRIAEETMEEIQKEQTAVFALAGKEFNLNSPKQLAEVLYDDLGLPSGKKRSTSADVLEKFAGMYEIIDHILVYRKLSKIYSTYAEGLKKYIQKDGRIHTLYNQCATQTGRLSSSEPNLQNISVRDEQGREIRKAFLPDEGCVLISSDYHQIELRMLAHMADEKSLIEAFNEGIDIHTKTAMDVFDKTEEEVTPSDRRQAKTVNFGIVYGISDFGLAEQLGVSRREAADFIETYYQKYPGIRTYMESLVTFCEKNGYVKTLCGRRRDIPEIRDKNRMVREFGKRAAMNAPIQGSAADLIKIAMIHIDEAMTKAGVKSRMILQVHDELIFNVPEEETEAMKKLITDGMEHAMELKVPLSAECAVGRTWYEAK
ncbi:MAG: DNA polymerase I [Solobacterium sp.]|nr:DNA polymerase I [Solobacterium sp.]